MEKRARRPRLAKIPAWALSLMTLIALITLLVFLEDPQGSDLSTFQVIGYTFCFILITGACFYTCRIHPNSVWYTLLICNAVSIPGIIAFVLGLSNSSEFIYWGGIFIFSIIAAFWGAKMGKMKNKAGQIFTLKDEKGKTTGI